MARKTIFVSDISGKEIDPGRRRDGDHQVRRRPTRSGRIGRERVRGGRPRGQGHEAGTARPTAEVVLLGHVSRGHLGARVAVAYASGPGVTGASLRVDRKFANFTSGPRDLTDDGGIFVAEGVQRGIWPSATNCCL